MASEFEVSKTIRLTALEPLNYRLWAAQTEATFSVYGVLDIVLGQRLRPQVSGSASSSSGSRSTRNSAGPLTEDAQATIKWDRQHALARQALLACLPPSELTKVYQLQSASEIWARLAQEHGAISTARRAMASRNFYQLIKAPSTSIQTHINVFVTHLQDLNYNLDTPLPDVDINIAFLASLGSSWQTFQQSMGERANTLKPAMLYAEVLAFEAQKAKAEQSDKAIGNDGNGEKVANFTRIPRGRIEKRRRFQGKKNGIWNGHEKRKFCNYCKRFGHLIDECYKVLWKKQIAEEDEDGHEGNYHPTFTGGDGSNIFNGKSR